MSELLWAGLMDLRWFYLLPSIGRIYFTCNDSIHDRNITNEKITHGRKLGTTEHVVKYKSEKIVAKCNHITTRQHVANLEGKDHSSFS